MCAISLPFRPLPFDESASVTVQIQQVSGWILRSHLDELLACRQFDFPRALRLLAADFQSELNLAGGMVGEW